jgi:hypothetical protein
VRRVVVELIDIEEHRNDHRERASSTGFTVCCPHCQNVLSVGFGEPDWQSRPG